MKQKRTVAVLFHHRPNVVVGFGSFPATISMNRLAFARHPDRGGRRWPSSSSSAVAGAVDPAAEYTLDILRCDATSAMFLYEDGEGHEVRA